jgi:electron transport complex protein RnfB
VCPTDAILGAPKMIHYVLTEACTGCGACVDVCPTEAVLMADVVPSLRTWTWPKPVSKAA